MHRLNTLSGGHPLGGCDGSSTVTVDVEVSIPSQAGILLAGICSVTDLHEMRSVSIPSQAGILLAA